MPSTADQSGSEDSALLPQEEALDDGEIGDFLDEGYSPGERPLGIDEWGTTAREAGSHEDLGHRLAREVRERTGADDEDDGIGDASDTDGELLDDEVGGARAGRLVGPGSESEGYVGVEYWARDVGIDGGAASAEEAAVHVVQEEDDDYR